MPFSEIKEFEAKGPLIFAIKLKDGDEIQFKNVDELISLIDELGKFCPDVTQELVRMRIVKFEDRLNRWGGSKE